MRNYSSWASYLPGMSIIRNHVINPLLVATEYVVETYIPTTATAEQQPGMAQTGLAPQGSCEPHQQQMVVASGGSQQEQDMVSTGQSQ